MKKHLIYSFVLMLIVSSCKKADVSKNTSPLSIFKLGSVTNPTVSNGMLVFQNAAHFDAYINALKDAIKVNETDTTSIDADSVLTVIENGLGYNSLRQKINSDWAALNDIGWTNVNDIPEDHFLVGEANRSVYNSYGDVKIGSAISHLHSKDYQIIISDGNLTTLAKAHALTSNDSAYIFNYFAYDRNVLVYQTKYRQMFYTRGTYSQKVTADTTWLSSFSILGNNADACNYSKKFGIWIVTLYAQNIDPLAIWNNLDKMDILVNWGDNTTSSFNNMTVHKNINPSGIGYYLEWPLSPTFHEYASSGNFTITVYAKRPYHTNWVASSTATITVQNFQCNYTHKETPTIWAYSGDGKRAVSGKLSIHSNVWGRTVFDAETKAYIKDGNTFKNKKVERVVSQLWFDRYTDCNAVPTAEQRADWPYDAKSANCDAGGYSLGFDLYHIVYSNHRILYNGSYVNLDLQLAACE